MAYNKAIVNVPGKYNGVLRQIGDEIDVSGMPAKSVANFIASNRLTPVGGDVPLQVSATELGYVDGATSNIQDQLDTLAGSLADYATTASLADYATTASLADYVPLATLIQIAAAAEDFAAFKAAIAALD